LYLKLSPFHMMWFGMHALISPAASHSGWEDHWQSDQYHYLHHTKFECNYGTPGTPFDLWFGTFREKLGSSSTYKGQGDKSAETKTRSEHHGVHTSAVGDILPKPMDAVYFAGTFAIAAVLYNAVAGASGPHDPSVAPLVASLVSFGPIALALLLCWAGQDKVSLRWPFHKEVVVGSFGLHLLFGLLLCNVPVFHTVAAVLSPHQSV